MVSRRNRKIAPKRLGRKQTKKNWFQKLMYGGVLTNEEQIEELSATIKNYKAKLGQILEKIRELKELSKQYKSDEDKQKITDTIEELMVKARTLKKKIETSTNELKKREEEEFAKLQKEVDKDFKQHPSGFSAARATQSVVGSMAQVKEAMSKSEKLLSELEDSKASVSAGPTQLTKVPGASGTAPKQTKVNIDELKKRLELITDIIGQYEEKKKQGELDVDRGAEIDKRIKELTYDKQQTESLLKTNTIAENTMKIVATRTKIAEYKKEIKKNPQNKELTEKLAKFEELFEKLIKKQDKLTQSGGTLKKHRKSKLHRKHRRTIKY